MLIQKHKKSIILTILVTITLYLTTVIIFGWNESVELVSQITITGWLSLITCSFISYLLRYTRWNYFIRKLGFSIPHTRHFLYYLSAFALTITPAKVGETIRSLYLFEHGVSYTKSISAFFVERLLDLAVVTTLSSLLLYQHDKYKILVITLFCVILTLVFLLRTNYFLTIIGYLNSKTTSKKITKLIDSVYLLLQHSKILLQYRSLVTGLLLGFIAWSIQGTAFYILLGQLGFDIPIYIAVSIYSIALISGALSFMPGGIGSTEIVMGVFLYYFGAPKEIVIIAPIIIRITSLWFAVLVGLISTTIITRNLNPVKS